MNWMIDVSNCLGCGACVLQCKDIALIDKVATIKNPESLCIERAAKVCPKGLFRRVDL